MATSTEPFGTTPAPTRRLPRARIAVPLLGLVAAALVGSRLVDRAAHPNEATLLGMAGERGILLAGEHPPMGTPMYEWDPEINDCAPIFIGKVIDTNFRFEGKRYILVKRPHQRGLCLDIKKAEMRYWVRKDGR